MWYNDVERMCFPSKRDRWLTVLLWVTAVACIASGASQLASESSIVARVLISVILFSTAILVLWILYGTHYTFTEKELLIRSGPFKFHISLPEVVSAEPSRNPLSSPACSLDRLSIRYGNRRILVSPEQRVAFLETLSRRGSHLVLKGDRVMKEGDA